MRCGISSNLERDRLCRSLFYWGNLAGDCSGGSIASIPENALTLVGDFKIRIGSGGLEWFVHAAGQYQSERAVYGRVKTAVVDTN